MSLYYYLAFLSNYGAERFYTPSPAFVFLLNPGGLRPSVAVLATSAVTVSCSLQLQELRLYSALR
jgi:hypothetical protein